MKLEFRKTKYALIKRHTPNRQKLRVLHKKQQKTKNHG